MNSPTPIPVHDKIILSSATLISAVQIFVTYGSISPNELNGFLTSLLFKITALGGLFLGLKKLKEHNLIFAMIMTAIGVSLYTAFGRDYWSLIMSSFVMSLVVISRLKPEIIRPSMIILVIIPTFMLWFEINHKNYILISGSTVLIFLAAIWSLTSSPKNKTASIIKTIATTAALLSITFVMWKLFIPKIQKTSNPDTTFAMNQKSPSSSNYDLSFIYTLKTPGKDALVERKTINKELYWHQDFLIPNNPSNSKKTFINIPFLPFSIKNIAKKEESEKKKYFETDVIPSIPLGLSFDAPFKVNQDFPIQTEGLTIEGEPYFPSISGEKASDKTQKLVDSWRAEGADDRMIVQKSLMMFRDNFQYTLNPPEYTQGDEMDDFLFNSKKGYCTQFTLGFIEIMKAANIPVTPISGFLGGTKNPYNGIYEVYEKDRHAWAYVKLGDKFELVDPTVAPNIDPPPSKWSLRINEINQRIRAKFSENNHSNSNNTQLSKNKKLLALGILFILLLMGGMAYFILQKQNVKNERDKFGAAWNDWIEKAKKQGYDNLSSTMTPLEVLAKIKEKSNDKILLNKLEEFINETYENLYEKENNNLSSTIKKLKKMKIPVTNKTKKESHEK